MHERGLLYCDMKPANVIHFGRAVKVVDLGAVRAVGDLASAYVYTPGFAPPKDEIDRRGWHVDSDLYTVGTTLQALARGTEPARGLAADSFRRLVARATHAEPRARFHSAAEMSRQLWEVLREFRALRFGEQLPESSTRFRPSGAGLDAGLGAIPALGHWTRRTGDRPAGLDASPPHPAEVAGALPEPVPDPEDGAALLLDSFPPDAPDRVARQWPRESRLGTPETALWLCRAYLGKGEQRAAESWLAEAETQLGERAAAHDWRIAWHHGVLHLSKGEVGYAGTRFDAVYQALPGEYVPKLALGYCAEHTGGTHPDRAMRYYEAVWKRDFAHAAAAFGLARGHLAAGDRDAAVRVLDEIPATSRHHDAARVAAVRIRAGILHGTPPTPAGLRDAARRLPGLRLDGGAADGESRARLVAEVRENALYSRPAQGWGPDFPAGDLLGEGTRTGCAPGWSSPSGNSPRRPAPRGARPAARPGPRRAARDHLLNRPPAPGRTAMTVAEETEVTLEVGQRTELPALPDPAGHPSEREMHAILEIAVHGPSGAPHATPAPGTGPALAEVLIVDTSRSMLHPPAKLHAAKDATAAAVRMLPFGTAFAVLSGRFDATVVHPGPGRQVLAVARPGEREAAERAVRILDADGGTAIGAWLDLARGCSRTSRRPSNTSCCSPTAATSTTTAPAYRWRPCSTPARAGSSATPGASATTGTPNCC
ncbi:tetratricopeptide repeat protein [Streptomyces nogalater]